MGLLLTLVLLFSAANPAHAVLSKFANQCESLLDHRRAVPATILLLAGSILAFPFLLAAREPTPVVAAPECARSGEANVDVNVNVGSTAGEPRSLGPFKARQIPDSSGCLDSKTKYQFLINVEPSAAIPSPDADMASAQADFEASGVYKTEVVYRYNGEKGHYFALSNTGAGVPESFGYEGEVFSIYLLHYPGTMALWSCTVGERQFLSVNSSCEGQPKKGKRLGFIISPPSPTLRPLYRLREEGGDYIEDPEYADLVKAGYTVEGILGYVP